MAELDDGYPGYYAERLWQLLPGAYRSADAAAAGIAGPLRELVDRIGAEIAVTRRSIDRLWADQSIETCDDWVLPYLGDLLGTHLVSALDGRGRRLDVANTIHYRRRKGTVAVLEEIAHDITGHTAHVVEGFRRLARHRHGLDPGLGAGAYPGVAPGAVAGVLAAQGLTGARSGTPAGGCLDLRNAHGAALTGGPFDESFHHLDVRAATEAVGHHGIEKLLVFLWRLRSFTVSDGTPVTVPNCGGLAYGADPTGRELPLFLPEPVTAVDASGDWTSAQEWQVPGRLSTPLAAVMTAAGAPVPASIQGAELTELYPEIGRFATAAAPSTGITVSYSYGFAAEIGAGPYDRTTLGDPPARVEPASGVTGGAGALATALESAPVTGSLILGDSLTYTSVAPAGSSARPLAAFLLAAGAQQRPVLRVGAAAGPWVFTGAPGAELVLDGLLLSGADLILRGAFASVRITACTLDPGTAAAGPVAPGASVMATAIDGAVLGPSRIFVEADPTAAAGNAGALQSLSIDHCITGPVRTRNGGALEALELSDSIVQAIPTTASTSYAAGDVYDPLLLAEGVLASADPLAAALLTLLPAAAQTALTTLRAGGPEAAQAPLDPAILTGLNALVARPTPLYDPSVYPQVTLGPELARLVAGGGALDAADLARLNRGLLDAAFPVALGLAAIAVADATVTLDRVTVLGDVAVRRWSATDSILAGLVTVADLQAGTTRFCAVGQASRVPRAYRCATIPAGGGLFTSDAFGDPGYGQLLPSADGLIVSRPLLRVRDAAAGGEASIIAGASTGSELGAFSAGMEPVNEQAMALKFAEYMPLGLDPVVVHVT